MLSDVNCRLRCLWSRTAKSKRKNCVENTAHSFGLEYFLLFGLPLLELKFKTPDEILWHYLSQRHFRSGTSQLRRRKGWTKDIVNNEGSESCSSATSGSNQEPLCCVSDLGEGVQRFREYDGGLGCTLSDLKHKKSEVGMHSCAWRRQPIELIRQTVAVFSRHTHQCEDLLRRRSKRMCAINTTML
jgi:hypothetical protein